MLLRSQRAFILGSIAALGLASPGVAQITAAGSLSSDWHRIGGVAFDAGLSSPATGPIDRVWYDLDGSRLYARTTTGKLLETSDFERWAAAVDTVEPPPAAKASATRVPESGARLRVSADRARLYSFTSSAFRSDDGGITWSNLTQSQGRSILGQPAASPIADLAISPRDADEIVVGATTGVWRSTDGGLSWSGLNQFLPNLPVKKIYSTPNEARGLRLGLSFAGTPEVEWVPGEQTVWQTIQNKDAVSEEEGKLAAARQLGNPITAFGTELNILYVGGTDGQVWTSTDRGTNWTASPQKLGKAVESFFVYPKDPRIALAIAGSRVFRTMNGGIFWDDLSANLPDKAAHGITADVVSGAVYVATDAGVFLTVTDLTVAAGPTNWLPITDRLPSVPAMDVKLDPGGNQLFVALYGAGVYTSIAPHRLRDFRMVNAADFSARATAPGGLLSILGAKLEAAQSGSLRVPILAVTDLASQVQVPFEAQGTTFNLSVESGGRRVNLGLPLMSVSPAIFVDPDGTPLILDAESGILLDGSKPTRSKTRIQVLTTGLGRVKPDWPAGTAAPLVDPPRVLANVKVFLDKIQLTVTKAILAPGYVGFYLIEVELPSLVNNGAAELYVEADGQVSNRVRLAVAQ